MDICIARHDNKILYDHRHQLNKILFDFYTFPNMALKGCLGMINVECFRTQRSTTHGSLDCVLVTTYSLEITEPIKVCESKMINLISIFGTDEL